MLNAIALGIRLKRCEYVSNTYHSVCNNGSALNSILTSLECLMSNWSEQQTNIRYRLSMWWLLKFVLFPMLLLFFLLQLCLYCDTWNRFFFIISCQITFTQNYCRWIAKICYVIFTEKNFFPSLLHNLLLITKWVLTKVFPLFSI